MDIYPLIELRDGRITRVLKNDFDSESQLGSDAVGVAKSFQAAGAPWVHVVDLDAARTGKSRNRVVVAAIASEIDIPVQVAGGVKDLASAEALLDLGVRRVVVDPAVTDEPGLIEQLTIRHPQRIALGLDCVASGTGALLERYAGSDLAAFVLSNLDSDGGLNVLLDALRNTSVDVVAVGGVESLEDLQALAELNVGGRRVAGAIVGNPIYENKFTITDAVVAGSVP